MIAGPAITVVIGMTVLPTFITLRALTTKVMARSLLPHTELVRGCKLCAPQCSTRKPKYIYFEKDSTESPPSLHHPWNVVKSGRNGDGQKV